ncbi:hypothetical protein LOK49_LG08G01898 [Camellia lanceoleosa]|uniref:Uncharacterized protein n=1 Tax=Camellia lanceoleosa TaxID=1840588 RepID=A0ACC0GYQ1_9ERIC|nr:hypothetical protein LOK49_LG08G01898 [Camellia lanceoleosa]
MLLATKGERKLEEREALGEDQLRVRLVDEDSMRVMVAVVRKKCEAMVAASIADSMTIIPRNTTLLTSKSEVFSTAADGHTSVEINVFTGEESLGGTTNLWEASVLMVFHQLHVVFHRLKSNLTSMPMVDKMVKEAEKFAKEDKEKKDAIDTKNQAESVVYQTEKQLKELGGKVPPPVKKKVETKLKELKDAISVGSTQTIKDAMASLNQEVMQLGQSLYS